MKKRLFVSVSQQQTCQHVWCRFSHLFNTCFPILHRKPSVKLSWEESLLLRLSTMLCTVQCTVCEVVHSLKAEYWNVSYFFSHNRHTFITLSYKTGGRLNNGWNCLQTLAKFSNNIISQYSQYCKRNWVKLNVIPQLLQLQVLIKVGVGVTS